jgi:hypothetical protein
MFSRRLVNNSFHINSIINRRLYNTQKKCKQCVKKDEKHQSDKIFVRTCGQLGFIYGFSSGCWYMIKNDDKNNFNMTNCFKYGFTNGIVTGGITYVVFAIFMLVL